MSVFEIPLQPATPQRFHISLGGSDYTFSLVWNTAAGYWVLDLGDTTEAPIVRGLPLITGADLLAQYRYLPLPPGQLICQGAGNPDTLPGWSDLGSTSHLFYVSP